MLMLPPRRHWLPPLGLGLASVTLGAVALMLFVLPILAIPIASSGLALGFVGSIIAIANKSLDLRLAAAGTAVCLLALAVGIAMASAPGDVLDPRFPSPAAAPAPPPLRPSPPAPFRGSIRPTDFCHLV
jgi:hypothetical protein